MRISCEPRQAMKITGEANNAGSANRGIQCRYQKKEMITLILAPSYKCLHYHTSYLTNDRLTYNHVSWMIRGWFNDMIQYWFNDTIQYLQVYTQWWNLIKYLDYRLRKLYTEKVLSENYLFDLIIGLLAGPYARTIYYTICTRSGPYTRTICTRSGLYTRTICTRSGQINLGADIFSMQNIRFIN